MPTTKLPVDTNASAIEMAETMFGAGISIVSATYSGDPLSSGTYANGQTISPGAVPADTGVILSTGHAADFTNEGDAPRNNLKSNTSTNTSGPNGDPGLSSIVGRPVYDAASIEAVFVPEGDTLTMQLIFGSEEYLEWVNSGYNDVVGIWVNGELAEMTIGDGDISIDNINTQSNQNLFIDNTTGALNTEMDGLTTVVTVKAPVTPGAENTIRIGIADDGDSIYDSNLLIVGQSVQSQVIAQDDQVTVASLNTTTIDLLANDTAPDSAKIIMINGETVTAGDSIMLEGGETLTLNDDGTVTISAAPQPGESTLTYMIESADGTRDLAFVTIVTSPVDGTSGDDQMMVGYVDADGQIIDGDDGTDDFIFGYGGDDKIFAGAGNDQIFGGQGNDFIRGGAGDDIVEGGQGNDVVDGGLGADTMSGGDGDDIYYIYDQGDVLIGETGGHDLVHSAFDHLLDASFEDLTLMSGSSAVTGTGNASDNKITGNGNANVLTGFGGSDVLLGYGGNDSLDGGDSHDQLHGGDGEDMLSGGSGNDKLTGDAGDDILEGGSGGDTLCGGEGEDQLLGGAGDDILGGGAGADRMEGGTGDDQYVVETVGDLVVEGADGGQDRVRSSIDYSLSENVEDLYLTGTAVVGNGNTLNNSIFGNSASNQLSGGDGADRLVGGTGDDRLEGGTGKDNLDGGTGNDHLMGGEGNDKLKSGSGNDILEGGTGSDRLSGGTGEDVFVFNTGDGKDVLYDFGIESDSLLFRGVSADDLSVTSYGKGIKLHYGDSEIYMLGLSVSDFDQFDITYSDGLLA